MNSSKTIINTAMPHRQQGAALIVVLLVLILITLVGVIVVRNSNTDLRLATASQIDSLLFISAEQPNAAIEREVDDSATKIFSETEGMIGYFMSDINESNSNHKLVTCFRPQKAGNPFNYDDVAIFDDKNTYSTSTGRRDANNTAPFCNADQSADYGSGRNATLTQITMTRGAPAAGAAKFVNSPLDVDIGNSQAKNYSITVDSVSALPAYGSASDTTVTKCYQLDGKKLENCLLEAGIPNKSVSQNYIAKFQDKIEEK